MSVNTRTTNRLKDFRTLAGMTQTQLAELAGVSRTAVTAIENERLVPSVAAALALAQALHTTVESLFSSQSSIASEPQWACETPNEVAAFWEAEIGGKHWLYPATCTPASALLPDGWRTHGNHQPSISNGDSSRSARQTLVIACCDPAVGILASEYARATGMRLLVLQRSGRQALELLHAGKVHVAGLHFSTDELPDENSQIVRSTIEADCQLLRVAHWQEGIAIASSSRIKSVRGAAGAKLRWVGREKGSGARQCMDRVLGAKSNVRRTAGNHQGVVEAIASGWADAGICVRVVSAEAGLEFLPVQNEAYDLCFTSQLTEDPRIQALMKVVRSNSYRNTLAHLPGYNTDSIGQLAKVQAC